MDRGIGEGMGTGVQDFIRIRHRASRRCHRGQGLRSAIVEIEHDRGENGRMTRWEGMIRCDWNYV